MADLGELVGTDEQEDITQRRNGRSGRLYAR